MIGDIIVVENIFIRNTDTNKLKTKEVRKMTYFKLTKVVGFLLLTGLVLLGGCIRVIENSPNLNLCNSELFCNGTAKSVTIVGCESSGESYSGYMLCYCKDRVEKIICIDTGQGGGGGLDTPIND